MMMNNRYNVLLTIVGLILFLMGQGAGWGRATAAPMADMVGINGQACAYPTIVDALGDANDGDTIYLAPGTYNESLGEVALDLHFVAATADCTAAEPDADPANYVINGTVFAVFGGVVHVAESHTITFTKLTLQTGQASNGGVLYVGKEATAVLDNSHVQNGVAIERGGLIYVAADGQLFVNAARLSGGSAGIAGGGLYLLGTAEFLQSGIEDASAPQGGGGAVAGDGYLVLRRGSWGDVSPNIADSGGGLYLTDNATLETFEAPIRGNQATNGHGGGIYAQGPNVTITLLDNTRIIGNEASGKGGGIYVSTGASLLLDEESYVGHNQLSTANRAEFGAGIYADGATVRLQGNSQVQNNVATQSGGGVYLDGGSEFYMTGGLMRNNEATNALGGGLLLLDGQAFLDGVTIQENEAGGSGGGLVQYNSVANEMAIINSQVISNTAVQDGGGLFVQGGQLIWQDTDGSSRLAGNVAGGNGGGVYREWAGILYLITEGTASHFVIEHNHANVNGGAIYNEQGNLILGGNVWLQHNTTAIGNGGGVYQVGGELFVTGSSMANRLLVQHNQALNGNGGGLYLGGVGVMGNSRLSHVSVAHNTALGAGGGLFVGDNSSLDIIESHIHYNQAGTGGGLIVSNSAVQLLTSDNPESCRNAQLPANQYCSELRGNIATAAGGGAIYNHSSEIVLENTAVISNTAATAGGIRSVGGGQIEITNSLFTHNSDRALLIEDNATLDLQQTTLADNDWAINITSPGATVNQANNIVWGNGTGVVSAAPAGLGCTISQNFVWGAMVDPLFHTTLRGDYRLGAGSPAIDNCGTGADVDMDDIPRPQGPKYDAGAFESGLPLILFPATLEILEGDTGLTPLPLVLTFSEPTQSQVKLVVATFSDTALSGTDFVPFTQTVVIPTGTISHTIPLEVVGEELHEGSELFFVELSEAQGAALADVMIPVTIVDDDPVSITVTDATAVEGDEGTTPLLFTVSLSNPSVFTTTVDFETGAETDTAVANVDYQASSGTIIIAPGQTSAVISIRVYGDEEEEADETLTLNLSNPQGATLVNTQATGTIIDDDGSKQIFLPFISR